MGGEPLEDVTRLVDRLGAALKPGVFSDQTTDGVVDVLSVPMLE